jgi:hypothetical protein
MNDHVTSVAGTVTAAGVTLPEKYADPLRVPPVLRPDGEPSAGPRTSTPPTRSTSTWWASRS